MTTTDVQTAAAAALADEAINGAMTRLDALDTFFPHAMGDADAVALTDLGTLLSEALKRCVAQEKAVLGPSDAALEKLHEPFRRTRNALQVAIGKARVLLADYRTLVRTRAEAAERERQQAEAAARAKEESLRGISLPPVEDAVAPGFLDTPAPTNVTRGAVGTATGRRNPAQFEVIDKAAAFAALPHLFVLDEAKARLELRAAQARDKNATLPGIRHWVPESVAFGRRTR